jgi:Tfp pilus assembly protein PilV
MKHPFSNTKRQLSRRSPKQEQGLSLVISLMMGMVLVAGVTGLLIRQLTARKLAASESYQQMAETAALNGFNRILSELNDDNSSSYKGYLLTLDHNGGNIEIPGSEEWGWNANNREDFPLRELCTDRSFLPKAVPATDSNTDPPPTDLTEATISQRNDERGNIKLQYRLRGYKTTASAENRGLGEGTFQIEGIVVREDDNTEKNFLARTLLLRSLYISSIVAGEGDWAVLSGPTLFLGNTEILNSNGTIGDGKVLLNVNSADNYTNPNNCLPSNLLADVHASSTNDNLRNRVIPILERGLPNSSLWNLGKTEDKQIDSDNIRIWSFDDTKNPQTSNGVDNDWECKDIACSRESNEATATGRSDLVESNGDVIRLSANELCKGSGNDCHVYVEHINLTKTRLLIETSENRPVVLHLEYPGTSTVDPAESNITGSINLASGSQLCGVDSGSSNCNGKPEELVILSAVSKPNGLRSCLVTPQSDPYVLAFEGDSLPHATIHLIPGIVKTGSSRTSLNGLIWADGICTNSGPFSLITDTSQGGSVVRALSERWGWESKNFPGYGQMVTRGVRGTGLDTFRRW